MYYNGKRDKNKTHKQRAVLKWAKKLKAIELLGGKCAKCGHSNPCSLEFHHHDDNKEAGYHSLAHHSWATIKKEILKCTLLCSNCHSDLHFSESFNKHKEEIYEKMNDLKDNCSNRVDHGEIIMLNKQGISQSQIAKKLKCGLSTVCEVLKSNGIHTHLKRRKIDVPKVLELRKLGMTNPQIAEKLGINRYSIAKAVKKYQES